MNFPHSNRELDSVTSLRVGHAGVIDCQKTVSRKWLSKSSGIGSNAHYKMFTKALIHKFFLPEFDFLLQKAKRVCVYVMWFTSPYIVTLLQQNLTIIETEFFKKHGIDAITLMVRTSTSHLSRGTLVI